jgi:CheY-like chemotaxis protein
MANKVTVLLVDDESFNFEMLNLTLGEGFDLHYVESGQEALSGAVTLQPDVMLLDVCMPGLDGYDTCRLIKNTPETSSIPVIMISGLENNADKQEAFDSGCDAYFEKPFDINQLKEQLLNIATKKDRGSK